MARRRRTRGLSDEERKLWNSVASTIAPIESRVVHGADTRRTTMLSKPDPVPDQPPKNDPTPPAPLKSFRIGAKVVGQGKKHDHVPTLTDKLAAMPAQTDKRTRAKMKRGKLKPEARIDLHGMTQSQAHPRLSRFILDAYDRQLRLVLVITGKGKDRDEGGPMPAPRGVLRHMVPQWLSTGGAWPGGSECIAGPFAPWR